MKETELSIIAIALQEPRSDGLEEAIESGLRGADFENGHAGMIWDTILDLQSHGRAVDPVTVKAYAEKRGAPDEVLDIITQAAESTSRATHATDYADEIIDRSERRRIADMARRIANLAEDGDEYDKELTELATSMTRGTDPVTYAGTSIHQTMARFRYMTEHPGELLGMSTGLRDLDTIIGGLENGRLYILAARPAMGKSALALNIAEAVARQNKHVLFVSLEMGDAELDYRRIAAGAMVDYGMLTKKPWNLSRTDIMTAQDTAEDIARTPLHYDHSSGMTAIRMTANRMRRRGELDMLVIDYLQLITGGGKSDNRTVEVGKYSRALKTMAQDLNIPVLVLSQVTRAPAQRDAHVPELSDLRESGSIEQDADVVMVLNREGEYTPELTDPSETELYVKKNRSGERGKVCLAWRGEYQRFLGVNHERSEKNE